MNNQPHSFTSIPYSHEFLMQFFMNLMQIYEPVTEGSYIKMIDMVRDQGGQMQVSALACV